jgi:beta-lactamase class A
MTRIPKRVLIGVSLAVLIFLGLLFLALHTDIFKGSQTQSTQVRVNLPEYKFINPLFFSDNTKSVSPYTNKIASLISQFIIDRKKEDSSVESISVYFRDLNTSQWTGVGEDTLYKPSSMLKALAMMAVFKMAEEDSRILNQQFLFTKRTSGGLYYEGKSDLKDGYYPLAQLVDVMIKNSDNDAFLAMVSDARINAEFNKIYGLFRLPPEGLTTKGLDFMSPKSYATLFRILYNSTFFSWDISEQALSLLSETTFDKGLVAGVPPEIRVSHKFGENTDQLHDCGIIYYPKNPYLLCVMTKGKNLQSLESSISGISKIVYEYVDSTK